VQNEDPSDLLRSWRLTALNDNWINQINVFFALERHCSIKKMMLTFLYINFYLRANWHQIGARSLKMLCRTSKHTVLSKLHPCAEHFPCCGGMLAWEVAVRQTSASWDWKDPNVISSGRSTSGWNRAELAGKSRGESLQCLAAWCGGPGWCLSSFGGDNQHRFSRI